MRILASGTPRLNLLLGYCNPVSLLSSSRFTSSLTYGLVLAVAVATGGTAGHCDGSSCFKINERMFGERRKQERVRKLITMSVKRLPGDVSATTVPYPLFEC
jgi:hypothetical protein